MEYYDIHDEILWCFQRKLDAMSKYPWFSTKWQKQIPCTICTRPSSLQIYTYVHRRTNWKWTEILPGWWVSGMTFLEVDSFFSEFSTIYLTYIDSRNYRCVYIIYIHYIIYYIHDIYIICYTYSRCTHYIIHIFYIHYIKHYTYIILHIIYVCMCVCVCIHIYIDKTLLYSDIARQGWEQGGCPW